MCDNSYSSKEYIILLAQDNFRLNKYLDRSQY